MTNMLVRTAQLGQDLAASLGDKEVVLMRGHGATMVAATIQGAVYRAMYSMSNAQIQLEAMRLGEVTYLAPEEAALHAAYSDEVVFRPWNLWKREVES
jgi:HCOMODA/2-hydroxy-3-carboxy-muconic semialdehyde decarboxylase